MFLSYFAYVVELFEFQSVRSVDRKYVLFRLEQSFLLPAVLNTDLSVVVSMIEMLKLKIQ